MGPTEPNSLQRPWVAWTAEQIDDPVGRLRFLKAVAPRAKPLHAARGRWNSAWITILAGVLPLLAIGLPLSRRAVIAGDGRTDQAQTALPLIKKAAASPSVIPPGMPPEIWRVENSREFETYSNGLRIENRYWVATRARSYRTFMTARPDEMRGEPGSVPVGIVFHTTESLQAPFEASQNGVLKKVGESLAAYVRRRHSYNFLIDRFGRVYRVVQESDTADHAGHSVWANAEHFYLNLNESFLGVSFEAQTAPGQEEAQVSPAQLRAAAMLTEMLRSRYRIPASNCVTHAQVSVNPANMQVGYHTDWASSFPFESVGLPDNYATPSPALRLFGFRFDESFAQRGGVRMQESASKAEELLRAGAAAEHLTLAAYRKRLQRRYRALLEIVRHGGVPVGDVDRGGE
jgi:hypothetical protein